MGLRWRGLTPDQLAEQFRQSISRTRRESKKIMREVANDILLASQQMAPLDDGELEQAHDISIVRLNRDDMLLEIGVGGWVGGVNVDEYAWIMHERLSPYGDLNLGPRSILKNALNPANRKVGGKFLERAADEYEPIAIERMKKALPGD